MKSFKRRLRGDDGGYIVVETVGTFIPFVLLVISILSLVNIVALQARVHYALTQAANTLSMYSYTLEVLGVAEKLKASNAKAQRVSREANAIKNDVNSVLSGIESLSDIGGAIDSGEKVVDRVVGLGEEAAADPKAALQLLMNYGIGEALGQAVEELARPLVGRYLANGNITGDAYLKGAGVVNKRTGRTGLEALEFFNFFDLFDLSSKGTGNSVLIDEDGNVKLVVEYEVLYTFGGLRLPFGPTLKITQTAVTKAWLGGSGKGYW